MPERIVATSEKKPIGNTFYRIEFDEDWKRMAGVFPTVTEAVAFAKAYAGMTWRVVEVTR